MKDAKENAITQRLIIQCADYSGFLFRPPLPLVPVIRPFHCSLAGRRRKEQRGKVELANFSIYEQISEGECSNCWLQRFFGRKRGCRIGGCGTIDFNHLVSLNSQTEQMVAPLFSLKRLAEV